MKYYKGMDISTLLEVEKCGAKFYDGKGPEDALDILKRYDVNAVRIRLWNDPYSEDGEPYGAGTNDFASVIALSRRAREKGFDILLDYHYSDFWADPGKQFIPKAWRGYSVEELEQAVYNYTKDTLLDLKEQGLLPNMVQVGNELTNGLLWPYGKVPDYDNIARFVNPCLPDPSVAYSGMEQELRRRSGENNSDSTHHIGSFCALPPLPDSRTASNPRNADNRIHLCG